jgi:hypothetical protein
VSPPDEFSLDDYGSAVHHYLQGVLSELSPELRAFRAVAENQLCLDGVEETALCEARSMSGPFTFRDTQDFSLRVLKAVDEHSWNVRNRHALEQEGEWTRDQIQTKCGQRSAHATTCIPVFCHENGKEWIDLYFLTGAGGVEKEGSLELL